MINWNDPKSKISKYFTVHEATFLPSWGVCHTPSEEEKANIIKTATAMDKIREFLGTPITVHVWMRPVITNCFGSSNNGKNYNELVKGAKNSAHIKGLAVDWHTAGTCDAVRAKLIPKLESLGICIEDMPGSNWVHVDIMPPRKTGRFFKP